jgi:hypothetical protein
LDIHCGRQSTVGTREGVVEGFIDGDFEGVFEGGFEGTLDGTRVDGTKVGLKLGFSVVGIAEGYADGFRVGKTVGIEDEGDDGSSDCACVGIEDACDVGAKVGSKDGCDVGSVWAFVNSKKLTKARIGRIAITFIFSATIKYIHGSHHSIGYLRRLLTSPWNKSTALI